MRRLSWLFVLGGCALAPAVGLAAIIHVPGDQWTIQAGIDAAAPGDTVLVADGVYTGPGNRDLDFRGKEITVRSAGGPLSCIIDCQASWPDEEHRGFTFHNGETSAALVQGFTIRRGWVGWTVFEGGAIFCYWSSPTIAGCYLLDNQASQGGGIALIGSASQILDCVLQRNRADYGGAGIYAWNSTPVVAGTVFVGNGFADSPGASGGGMQCRDSAAVIGNCLFAENRGRYGGGLYLYGSADSSIYSTTITGNSAYMAGAGVCGSGSFIDCIIWGNGSDNLADFGGTIRYSDVDSWPGEGNINEDPLFASGPLGDFYLGQAAAGQPANSPCLSTGSALAGSIAVPTFGGTVYLDQLTTRTDQVTDSGKVDMGFHYRPAALSAGLTCVPAWGTLPLTTTMTATLTNLHPSWPRRLAGRIDVTLAGGQSIYNWRKGYTTVAPGSSFVTSWSRTLPAMAGLVGINRFALTAEDVTPPPYNQPPYPPSGESALTACTVRGVSASGMGR